MLYDVRIWGQCDVICCMMLSESGDSVMSYVV